MTGKPLLVIDFLADGHHPFYICHLVRFSIERRITGTVFLISREARDIVSATLSPGEAGFFVSRVRLIEEEPAWLRIKQWTTNESLAQWLYIEYLNLYESKTWRLLFLFLESAIYQLALMPLPRFGVSGLMFRPTFYYRKRQMLDKGSFSWAIFAMKWFTAYMLAKRPGIKEVFLLDPLAEHHAASLWKSNKFRFVPDPVGLQTGVPGTVGTAGAVMKRPLVMLIAGALHPRKGIHSTVEALAQSSAETRQSVRLLVVGKPMDGFADYVSYNVTRLRDMGVQVESDLRYISDRELDRHVAQSHVVLTPYTKFRGSSGIIIRAAHFGKPVVSTAEGLIGYLVERHRLGETIDVDTPGNFSRCLDRIASTGMVCGFDPVSARTFADSCNPEIFAGRLLN